MKKLMIAFAALVCAVAANAATIQWNSGAIYLAGSATGESGSAKAGAGTVTAYFYELLNATDYATVSAMSAADLYTKYVAGGISTTVDPAPSKSLGSAANVKQIVGDASGIHYGLVIYVDTTTAANYDGVDAFVKSAVATVDAAASSTYSASNMASQQASWTAIGQAVPEPTSGLLLLLGMAGLALKRKRA